MSDTTHLPIRLVGSLGRRRPDDAYRETSYQTEDGRVFSSCFSMHALAQALRPAEILVRTTEKAWEAHSEELGRRLAADGLPAPSFAVLPAGGGSEVLWQQYAVLLDTLRVRNHEVVLDITNGFRSYAFLAAGVVAFAQAVWPDPPPMRLFYGAWELDPRPDHPTPLWDLTAFVDILGWAQGIRAFLRTGATADLVERTERWAKEAFPPAREENRSTFHQLVRFKDSLERFGEDLTTVRTGSLLLGTAKHRASALGLEHAIQEARDDVLRAIPPLAEILDELQRRVEPLAKADELRSAEGDRALVALARLYLDMERYSEAATTVRETWVTRFAVEGAACPGKPGYSKELREEAEQAWQTLDRGRAKTIADFRNDIDHAGYRPDPKPARTMARGIRKMVEDLEARTASETPCPPSDESTVLINLSNHPSATWSPSQTEAARALAPRIVDLPFPEVPPEADTEELLLLCDQVLGQVPDQARHALVQGESTLCHLLVSRLQRKGISCHAACTPRRVEEGPDGVRTVHFAFRRFRRYPECT